MKTAITGLYILLQIIYYFFADNSVYWGGFNICLHLAFIAYLSHLLQSVRNTLYPEKLLFLYIKLISIANIAYVVSCMIREEDYTIYYKPIFGYILGLGFISFIIHRLFKK